MYRRYLNILKFKDYDHYVDQINEANRSGIELLLGVDIVVCIINILIHVIASGFASFSLQMVIMLLYSVVVLGIYLGFFKKEHLNFTRWIFIFEMPLYIFAILMGTVFDPYSAAFTFPMIVIVFPLFMMAKPKHIMEQIVSYSVLFLALDYFVKPSALFYVDFLHVVNATLMAMGSTAFSQVIRIRNLIYADQLKEKSIHDPLTGAYNRDGCAMKVDLSAPGLFIFMDVDDFKGINDNYGHAKGDQVLIELVAILRENFRENDIIVRFGGDEFGVYSPGSWKIADARRKTESLIKAIHQMPIGATVPVSVSIGGVISHGEYGSVDQMMRVADRQMYNVKSHGKNSYQFSDDASVI